MRGEVLGNQGADYGSILWQQPGADRGSILWQQPGAGNMQKRPAAASIHRNI